MDIKVYLAGGMNNSNWQSEVIKKTSGKGFTLFNPSQHQLTQSREYTCWDLFYVNQCDVLFGYMQEANPSGLGLSLEVGYAKALNKLIILIDEKSKTDTDFKKYFHLVRESASITFEALDDGIDYLLKLKNGIS